MRDQELSGTTTYRSKIGVADTGTYKEKEMMKDYISKKKSSFDSNDWINFPIAWKFWKYSFNLEEDFRLNLIL